MECLNCVICGTELNSINENEALNKTALEKQLSAVFVLRKLLNVSQNAMQKCFAFSNGENPNSWLNYCDNCQQTVIRAESLYQQICGMQQQLRKYQLDIYNKVLASKSTLQLNQNKLYGIIRENAKQVIEVCDPTAGDRIADQLLAFKRQAPPLIPPAEIKLEPKSEPLDDSLAFDDDDYLSFSELDAEASAPNPTTPSPPPPPQQQPNLPKVKKLRKRRLKGRYPLTAEQEINFNCEQCGKTCKNRTALVDHIYHTHRKSKVPSIPCPHCDFLCARQNNLNRHIKLVHEKEYNYTCEVCGQVFSTSDKLRHHEAGQHFKCSVKNCQIICKSKERLREHQLKRHGREIGLFKCNQCSVIVTRLYALRRHVENKHGNVKQVNENG